MFAAQKFVEFVHCILCTPQMTAESEHNKKYKLNEIWRKLVHLDCTAGCSHVCDECEFNQMIVQSCVAFACVRVAH